MRVRFFRPTSFSGYSAIISKIALLTSLLAGAAAVSSAACPAGTAVEPSTPAKLGTLATGCWEGSIEQRYVAGIVNDVGRATVVIGQQADGTYTLTYNATWQSVEVCVSDGQVTGNCPPSPIESETNTMVLRSATPSTLPWSCDVSISDTCPVYIFTFVSQNPVARLQSLQFTQAIYGGSEILWDPDIVNFGGMGLSISRSLVVTPLSIATTSLKGAVSGVAYSAPLSAAGGWGGYTWSISGTLPSGITISGNTLSLPAAPAATVQTYSVTLKVTDGQNNSATKTLPLVIGPPFAITSPTNGASPRSAYVVAKGNGVPGSTITILVDGNASTTLTVGSDGHFEKVVNAGTGAHQLQMQWGSTLSNPVSVTDDPPLTSPEIAGVPYTNLSPGDIILTYSKNSVQAKVYGPTYSHAALYIGSDTDGTPLIAESVPVGEANGLGEVRRTPIEQSTVYTGGDKVDFFRTTDTLSDSERAQMMDWVNGVTNAGLHYWSVSTDLGWFGYAILYHDNAERFKAATDNLDALKNSPNKFICSTLVYQAYERATNGRIDLSSPNTAVFGGYATSVSDTVLNDLRPHFVFPDTIFLSGKVQKVTQ